jgi:primosomal protein N'
MVVVVDPIDPAMRRESLPYYEALDLADLRCRISRASLAVVSSAPPLESLKRFRVLVVRNESHLGPKIRQITASELDPMRGLSGWIADREKSLLSASCRTKLAVVVPRRGIGSHISCRKCREIQRCPSCGNALCALEPELETANRFESLRAGQVISGMWCARCREEFPAACLSCGHRKVRMVVLGEKGVASLLEGVLARKVSGADSPGEVTVGSISLLDKLEEAGSVLFWDFEQLFGLRSLVGSELSVHYLAKASRLVGSGFVYVYLNKPNQAVETLLSSGDLIGFYRSQIREREKLGLPPARAVAKVRGSEALAYLHTLEVSAAGQIEAYELGPESGIAITKSRDELIKVVSKLPVYLDSTRVKLELFPREF